jgi:hypothetical protein
LLSTFRLRSRSQTAISAASLAILRTTIFSSTGVKSSTSSRKAPSGKPEKVATRGTSHIGRPFDGLTTSARFTMLDRDGKGLATAVAPKKKSAESRGSILVLPDRAAPDEAVTETAEDFSRLDAVRCCGGAA